MSHIKDIYARYKQDVYIYLVSLTHDPILSEDLVSETFLAAIQSLHNFKGNSDIKTWLFSIARNKWYGYLRKNKYATDLDSLAKVYLYREENLEKSFIDKTIANKIMMLLEDEDERKRGIVLMRIEGYSFYEIAMKYNISESSARVIDFRTKKKIRGILEKEGLSND
ncbi:MAG: RNA polymerase sigma factor [Caldicoprobacterales bacterium]|mgnify:FL=1|jgi:RNA polymerase sigma-70 factor (ECF subfamily)|nr:RNA polymerase sigma factor [Clostridiales bacterium]